MRKSELEHTSKTALCPIKIKMARNPSSAEDLKSREVQKKSRLIIYKRSARGLFNLKSTIQTISGFMVVGSLRTNTFYMRVKNHRTIQLILWRKFIFHSYTGFLFIIFHNFRVQLSISIFRLNVGLQNLIKTINIFYVLCNILN